MEPETSILLADSDHISVELGKTYLRNTGARLFTCNNGEMAWDIVRRERPDLVFMSATMPGIDGLECCRLIKADESLHTTPVVLILVSGNVENIENCRKAGCDDVLLKPIERRTFFSKVKKFVALEKRNAPRFKARFSIHCVTANDGGNICNVFDVSTGGFLSRQAPFWQSVPWLHGLCFAGAERGNWLQGRVAWINQPEAPAKTAFPPGMGIEFVDLCAEGRQAIHDYLQKEHVARILKPG